MSDTIFVSRTAKGVVHIRRGSREVAVVDSTKTNVTPLIVRGPRGEPGLTGPPGPAGSGSSSSFVNGNSTISAFRLISNVNNIPTHSDILDEDDGDQVVGVSLNSAVNPGEVVEVQFAGPLSDPSFSFTPGLPVFSGPDGVLTQDPTFVSGQAWQLVVGHAIDPQTINLNLQDPIFLC